MVLLPSARVRSMSITVNGLATDDATYRWLGFTTPDEGDPFANEPVIAALLAIPGAGALLLSRRHARHAARPRPRVAATDALRPR